MKTKGIGDIRGIRGLNTRPGPMTESGSLLKLYRLAAEKDNLMKKMAWVKRQQEQVEKRLSEIGHSMQIVKQAAEGKSKTTEGKSKTATSRPTNTHSEARSTFIEY